MQLIKSWEDTRYKVTNFLYKLDGGIPLLHTLNENTLETVISVTFKAGSFFEPQLEVPRGTGHFLEHMIAGNPNKIHKTKKQLDEFAFGKRNRPAISTNASTGQRSIYFYGSTNSKGENRLAKNILGFIDYPTERFEEFIEKERKVILAERNGLNKIEKNEWYQFQNFMFGDTMPKFPTTIIGEAEDIKSITKEHLNIYFQSLLNKDSCIISVQSNSKINGKLKEYLSKIASQVSKRSVESIKYPKEIVDKSSYRYKHFVDEWIQGVKVNLCYFIEKEDTPNYKKLLLQALTESLINYVSFERMREKLGLVYSFRSYSDNPLHSHRILFYEFVCDSKDIKKAIDEAHDIIFTKAERFLKTKSGQKWFEDKQSRYIFPITSGYSPKYAQEVADSILWGREIYLFEREKEVAEKLTIEDLISFIRGSIQKSTPRVWLVSSDDEKIPYKALQKSKLHKYWSSSIPQKSKK